MADDDPGSRAISSILSRAGQALFSAARLYCRWLTGTDVDAAHASAAATWLMQRAAPEGEVAGDLGMSAETLREVYGHHHPDYMKGAIQAIASKDRVLVIDMVVGLESEREKRQKAS